MSYPSTYKAFRRSAGQGTKESPLSLEQTQETLPKKEDLGPNDVIIKIHSVSLNYRDVAMLVGGYPAPVMERGIPCSDCAAEVVASGSAVKGFKVGDRVAPHCNQGDFDPTDDAISVAIGANAPGVLREYAVFLEKHLVHLPAHLPWDEAAMLPCAGVTAWNALEGLKAVSKQPSALLQGTGGVSMVSLLLCLAANITPIITSSFDTKLSTIQQKTSPAVRGINYKTDDQAAKIKELTHGRGVDFVVNNTGVGSLIDDISYLAERGGTVSLVGFLAGFEADWKPVQIMDLMRKGAKIKGISVGSIKDFEELNRFVEEKGVRFGVMLDKVYDLNDAGKAFEHLQSGRFSGKIGIRVAA